MFTHRNFKKRRQNLLRNGAFQFVIGSFADELGQFGSIGVNSLDAITNLNPLGGFFFEFDFCAVFVCNFNTSSLLDVVELHNMLPQLVGFNGCTFCIFSA